MADYTDKPRVLIAEDERSSRKMLRVFLQKMGFQVTAVKNGRQAIDVTAQESFDIILLDMQMPHMSGYDAASMMRRRGIKTPIIAITAHARADDRTKCLAAGCTNYLSKPVCPDDLRKMLSNLCPVLCMNSSAGKN